jgi:hypothetical protein
MRRTPRPGRSASDARRGDCRRLWRLVAPVVARPAGPTRASDRVPAEAGAPEQVVAWTAREIGVAASTDLVEATGAGAHQAEIRRAYGCRPFSSPNVEAELVEWLRARLDHRGERPGAVRRCQRVPDGPTGSCCRGGARCGGSSAPHARMPTSAAGQCLPPGSPGRSANGSSACCASRPAIV